MRRQSRVQARQRSRGKVKTDEDSAGAVASRWGWLTQPDLFETTAQAEKEVAAEELRHAHG